MFTPEEILEKSIVAGTNKLNKTLLAKMILGFIGGAMISMGFLAYVRVSASIPNNLASVKALVGGAVFPIGLIVILLAGGELATGNMMAVGTAFFARKVSFIDYLKNLIVITLFNFLGAVFVAYFFGHIVQLTHLAPYKQAVVTIATGKTGASFLPAFVSGIGCNWLVGLAVWLSFGAKDAAGKILGIWFPIMIFVAVGFQHSIANCFIIPAAIFEGGSTWNLFFQNFVPVYLGNIIGGVIFVAGFYYFSYANKK
ncbi:formate/nitrite transporter [Companilactobacillus crustorum]|uniref:Formate nitrite transporter family protein n=3 Tax=Companilactobacillus TaxID=2767879 RepID=A0A837RFP6_9LACO|nr:formate/nitrite transporter family protein [Companilactobacillus crustorum]KRK41812.1 formate nitrite transporter family protein [Companilactobacillus crustorum JCM 15951]KRO20676.1 formate nitrite transporter family protein [Companilactobacillus crustorum]GEO77372.1 formate/nitrite transporter [Companilactobacillus crustorum]